MSKDHKQMLAAAGRASAAAEGFREGIEAGDVQHGIAGIQACGVAETLYALAAILACLERIEKRLSEETL